MLRKSKRTGGTGKKKPGRTGEGKYYRIFVRSKEDFVTFRYHDVENREVSRDWRGKDPAARGTIRLG